MMLEAQSLSKSVGGRWLYRDLSFRVEEGEILAVRGASGSGKSQLLRQIAGLDPDSKPGLQQQGNILLKGRAQSEWCPFEWRSEVCRVPQQVPHLDGGPKDLRQRLSGFRAQRKRSNVDPFPMAQGFGLEREQWERPWSEMSVGESQRALLAILIAREPAVLLLDEPTAALDNDAALAVEEQLRGKTCLWITHSDEQAQRIANQTVLIGGVAHAD